MINLENTYALTGHRCFLALKFYLFHPYQALIRHPGPAHLPAVPMQLSVKVFLKQAVLAGMALWVKGGRVQG